MTIKEWIELWLSRIPNNLEIRPLKQKTYQPVKALFSRHAGEIETYLKDNDDCHLFFGVLGRQGQKGEKENVKQVHCLWVDIDFKDLPEGRTEADGIIATFDLQPTLIIASGGGYHVYWFLSEPVKDMDLTEKVLRGLATRLKGDIKSAEVARILRVPLSTNWKYNPPKPVTIERYEEENIYDFSEFRQWEQKESLQKAEQERTDWFADGTRDHDLHYVGCRLIEGGATPDATEEVLARLVNSWGENDPKWVLTKVKAAIKTIHKERGNLERRILDYIEKTTGQFSMVGMVQWLGLQGEDKYECGSIIAALHQAREIVSVGNKTGVFRKVDKNPDLMDLDEPDKDDIGIQLPFNLHTLVMLYPRNVVLVAGEKDAGKTAFAMNSAYLNRDHMKVTYFNSEMGTTELKSRIKKFPEKDFQFNEWKKIRWIERATRFEDYVDPDGLNIIDFLEVGAEAFTVTEDIKRVFDKLDKGLLLIVMQKRSYKEYAVGGEGTLEKARLAINLEHRPGVGNVCKITVAKNWTGILNSPRGHECVYKVWQGGKMEKEGNWYKLEDVDQQPKDRGYNHKKTY